MTNTAILRNIVVMLMYDKLNVVGISGNENQREKLLAFITKLKNAIKYFQEISITNSSQKIREVFLE